MADEKHQKQPLLKHTVDFPTEHESIISDHLMHITKDEKHGITLGTFNIGWAGESAILDSSRNKPIPSVLDDLERVSRGAEFLTKVTQKNPELDIIALQESAVTPIGDPSIPAKETIEQLQAELKKTHTPDGQEEIRSKIKRLETGTLLWEKFDFKKNMRNWIPHHTVAGNSPKSILYNVKKFTSKSVSISSYGLTKEFHDSIQAVRLTKKDDEKSSVIIYNVHFPASDNPQTVKDYISQIKALPENKDQTFYIMGGFNAPLPSLDAEYVDNGTSVVPELQTSYSGGQPAFTSGLRKAGQKCYGCTNGIFVRDSQEGVIPLKTKIVNFRTGEAEDLPTVSPETAEKDPYFFPVLFPERHLVRRYDGEKVTLPIIEAEAALKENKIACNYPEIFLEKNNLNFPRVVINDAALTPSQREMFQKFRVSFLKPGLSNDPADESGVRRFVLYPQIEKDFRILWFLPKLLELSEFLTQNPESFDDPMTILDASFLKRLKTQASKPKEESKLSEEQEPVENPADITNIDPSAEFEFFKRQSSHRLKFWSKLSTIAAVGSAIASIVLFSLSTAFVPAVFLAASAGLLGIAAGVLYTLGKHRGDFSFSSERPLAYKFAAIGTVIAASAGLVWGFAPAVAFVGIPLAPVVLAFAVAAIFFAAAISAALSKNTPVSGAGRGSRQTIYEADYQTQPQKENFGLDTLTASLVQNQHDQGPKKTALSKLNKSGYNTFQDEDNEASDQKSDKRPAPKPKKEEESSAAALRRETNKLHRGASTVTGAVPVPQAKAEEEVLGM